MGRFPGHRSRRSPRQAIAAPTSHRSRASHLRPRLGLLLGGSGRPLRLEHRSHLGMGMERWSVSGPGRHFLLGPRRGARSLRPRDRAAPRERPAFWSPRVLDADSRIERDEYVPPLRAVVLTVLASPASARAYRTSLAARTTCANASPAGGFASAPRRAAWPSRHRPPAPACAWAAVRGRPRTARRRVWPTTTRWCRSTPDLLGDVERRARVRDGARRKVCRAPVNVGVIVRLMRMPMKNRATPIAQ